MHQIGKCQCEESQYQFNGEVILRSYCHCSICQKFNKRPYADISLVYARDVKLLKNDKIKYTFFAKPELVKRGTCQQCQAPIIEFVDMPLLPKLAILPRQTMPDDVDLPGPECHIFYHQRCYDAQDTIPKYSGYLKSQTMFFYKLLAAMIKQKIK